jgi:GH35 family endo-1,4-beta-xylanase
VLPFSLTQPDYAGRFKDYDLFNEPLHQRAYADQCNLWDSVIPQAFGWAREADPSANYCLNE